MSVNCAWGDWSAYTGCTKTCGGGKQYRYRTILTHDENGGTACVGTDNVEEQDCNSVTCTGQYYYTIAIDLNTIASLICISSENKINVLVNCAWGEWSAYTGCTKTCGGGKQYRYRTILTHGEGAGTACVGTDNVEEQDCNSDTCPGQYY